VLSRVAESLYWMARNVERAETLARILDVNYNRTVDRNAAGRERASHIWRSVFAIAGISSDVELLDGAALASAAFELCTFSVEWRTSIVACIRVARASALSVRAELSTEVWECLNGLYLFVEAQSPRSVAREGPSSFLRSVRDTAQAFGGIVDATITHDDEWLFLQIGRYLERAAMTGRILRAYDAADEVLHEWQRLLEMCCASEPFAKSQRLSSEPAEALGFLFLHRTFPRSIRFCTHEVDAALHLISETALGAFSNEAERVTGRLQAALDFVSIAEILDEGSARFAGRIAERIDAVGAAVQSTYFPRVPVALA
jgi:uncharacterized alpha-E superfamily protein